MAANEYHFVTHWRVHSNLNEVLTVLGDAPALKRWWPSVYLDVQVIKPGDRDGLGRVVSLYTKGWLPYTLRWQFEVDRVQAPFGFSLRAWGDFEGTGVWTLALEDVDKDPGKEGWVLIQYDWRISAEKPLLKYFSFIMKPVFSANHLWAMARGEESLKLELARRQARTAAERDQVAAPPPPTFAFLLPQDGKATQELLA